MIFVDCFIQTVFGLLLDTLIFQHFLSVIFCVLCFSACMLFIRAVCSPDGGDKRW